MGERTRSEVPDSATAQRASATPQRAATPSAQPTAANALALQRAIGNRATAQVLSRWAAHPDKDKKGQLLTDEAVGDYNKFNPPLSK
jgi:hypothetical protein